MTTATATATPIASVDEITIEDDAAEIVVAETTTTTTAVAAATVTGAVDEVRVAEATQMRRRADGLRQQAQGLDEVLGTSYRRRASELEMQAWVVEVRAGVPDSDLKHAA